MLLIYFLFFIKELTKKTWKKSKLDINHKKRQKSKITTINDKVLILMSILNRVHNQLENSLQEILKAIHHRKVGKGTIFKGKC